MLLKRGDVVCFLGDSITCAGIWEAELFEKVASKGVKIYNCGVSGNRSYTAFSRIYEDCLIYNPSIVVVTLGINDIMSGTKNRKDPKIAKIIQKGIENYADYMERIIKTIQASGATAVIGDPVPYDEGEGYSIPSSDCNCDLEQCREIIHELAKTYKVEIIPFNEEFKKTLLVKKVIEDRVHPNTAGYKLMAKTVERFFELDVDDSEIFNLSQISKERLQAEKHFKDLSYIEYDWVAHSSFIERREYLREDKIMLAQKLLEDANEYVSRTANAYLLANADLTRARAKLIEKTMELYEYYNK